MGELDYQSGREVAARIRAGELSSREATTSALRRIAEVNPAINAVVTLVEERALAQADAADARQAAGEPLPPLHGVPMLHKDTHMTAEIRTTQGSPLFADFVPPTDDLVIERLRSAGVISLGKTNVPEFAAGSHTFNPVFGHTHNPYDVTKSAGGSSGGAAAALATGMVAFADGSDMGGSLRNPAAFCNVVGLRPSHGRVPNAPDPRGDETLATSGPMARSVDDVALLLSVLAGPDSRAGWSLIEPGEPFANVAVIDPSTLRIAIAADFGGSIPVQPEIVSAIEAAGLIFEGLGASVEQAMPDLTDADWVFNVKRAKHFARAFGMLVTNPDTPIKETIRWNVELGTRLSYDDLVRAGELSAGLHARVHEFFTRYDALLLPTTQVLPFDGALEYPSEIDGQRMSTYLEWMRSCSDITATGAPAISVPAGFSDDGLPIGLQIVTAHQAEAKLLSIAALFERPASRCATRQTVQGPRIISCRHPGAR